MAATTLTPGDIAIIGYVNNGSPDAFSFVTLTDIGSQTVIYFTDNGYTLGSPTGFRGVTSTNATGNEGVTRFTANNDIPAGTIIRSNESTATNFSWATSGAIGAGGNYSSLALGSGSPTATNGDQIAAVQSTSTSNPLLLGNFTPIYQIDYTGAFEDANTGSNDSNKGNVIPGLSQGSDTAVLFNNANTYAAFNLNTPTTGTTKADWLAAIDNSSNWTFNSTGTTATLPSSATAPISVNPVPEPMTMFGSLTALAIGAGLKQFRKRFQA